jgi:adenylate cyclase
VNERRLGAIMFTDMVGYTSLSQTNEPLALKLLAEHREVVRQALNRHHGREVKTIGDAFLVEFESALDAVNCSVDIQNSIREYNDRVRARLSVRIGIHVGDVVHDKGDVYGDAVNVASRIEPLADAGGVCISQQTYDQVRNKVPFKLVKLQVRELKHVSFSIDVYKVEMPWDVTGARQMYTGPLPADRVAVLPFVNISPDTADEYFADGMTEEIITSLSLVKGLKVIARTSVMNYKKKEMNVAEIGKELGVGTIVEGSVRKSGDRIRVTVQVIDVNSEEHLWASKYDAKLDDVFTVQSDIADKVAGSLPGALKNVRTGSVAMKDTDDVTAYTNFLQGRELMFDKLEAPLRQSIQFFEHAVERDPNFARAYACMGQTYCSLGLGGYMPWRESIDTAKAFIAKALSINEGIAEAHSLRSMVAYMADESFGIMEEEARKAIELNPNLAEAYLQLAEVMPLKGNAQEWVRLLETAYQLDPLSARIIERLGCAYLYTGRDADALGLLHRTVHLQPLNTHRWMWQYYASKGSLDEAAKEVTLLEALQPSWEYTLLAKGFLAAMRGDRKTAESAISTLEETHQLGWARSSIAGLIYFPLGDLDTFFEKMRNASKEHTLRATDLMYSPLLAKAREDPRMVEVFNIAGLRWTPPTT